ncbi:type II and III secretion system protein [Alcanivorax sp. JB21]|uniref:type II and III secretion system protein n=1 Tax=Alcanivorax limicola TaxID=2874102 RepID=UPI001CBCF699|nr:type II and III secretion system protein [Alcanivorax limicola]MBZ2187800.1 type II and III secretion system protein [Alcanivorax limicola]
MNRRHLSRLLTAVLATAVLLHMPFTPHSAQAASSERMETHIVDTLGGQALIPLIEPLLAPGGSIGHYQGRLVIRTTAESFSDITRLIADIDRAPRSVRISLRRSASGSSQQDDASMSGSVDQRGNVRGNVVILRDRQQQQRDDHYSINTLDGHDAFIDRGNLLQLSGYGPGNTSVLPLLQGIAVTPQLLPDGQIRLTVEQRFDEQRNTGEMHTQSAHSTLQLSPGQWHDLGGLTQEDSGSRQGLTGGQRQSGREEITLQVRVEVL